MSGKVAALILLLIVGGVGGYSWALLHPAPIPVPVSYSSYKAGDQSFWVSIPDSWNHSDTWALSSGESAVATDAHPGSATFSDGAVRVDIYVDLLATLKSNAMLQSSQVVPSSMTQPPVFTLHEQYGDKIVGNYRNYTEVTIDGKSEHDFRSKMGQSLLTEWTADRPMWWLTPPLHGYRVSYVAGDRTYVLVAQCPESEWNDMHPVFENIIHSLAPGPAAGANDTNGESSGGMIVPFVGQ